MTKLLFAIIAIIICAQNSFAQESDGKINGFDYIELAGLKWAVCNVGAKSSTEYGDLFYADKPDEVTPATNSWKSPWRIPSRDDYMRLVKGCKWEVATYNGVNVFVVSDPNNSSKKMYLPAAGYYFPPITVPVKQKGGMFKQGSEGYYWTSDKLTLFKLNNNTEFVINKGAKCSLRLVAGEADMPVKKKESYAEKIEREHKEATYTTEQLAEMYYNKAVGFAQKNDWDNAYVYFEKAAELGHVESQMNTGIKYNQIGDYEQSFSWWSLAAEQGNADAQYWLGVSYIKGWGVEQDIEQAITWIRKAADQGHKDAIEALQ